ncbi:pilus assembly PilX family protein [Methylibium petroleiphilum]|uniref:Uncharacterized protein n=2 Tax=Methylibium TaxID=316612 RepID=A2SLC1_METPP|nr:type II secretion system protein [Methylibium petroleiphilum]ABM96360.1 hypothetical protein Mpe_A3407 [Methylibium petroleiphilum PM1]EWS54268.1 Tfp pilus assembly protein PilX [Methylibium sp. T29]EWS59455.1 Tfp pilus assembly protein PilX [Methylibium sp. T29-B]
MKLRRSSTFATPAMCRQRGAVLIISLIVLVVMLISAAALMRSFDITLTTAGNLAFKRDVAQQSERAAEVILTQFRTGGALVGIAARGANAPAWNYSATVLPSNAQGIPLVLVDDAAFAATGWTHGDITVPAQQIRLRFAVDRLCTINGSTEEPENCVYSGEGLPEGGSLSEEKRPPPPGMVVYRLTIRATGPRDTQSFFQSTFSCCGV